MKELPSIEDSVPGPSESSGLGPFQGAEALLQRAKTQSTMLRRGFLLCASRRNDEAEWNRLEHEVAAALSRKFEEGLEGEIAWLIAAERALRARMSALLASMAPQSDRVYQYRRAAENLNANAVVWVAALGEAQVAYWKLAALAWMALWHAADTLNVSPALAKACLDEAFSAAPATGAVPVRPRWYEAPGRFAASFIKRA
jgi:hypothetical protein